jgi:hypothetical protein
MAVVPRSVADASPGRGAGMIRAVLVAVLLVAVPAAALDVSLDTYREAQRAGTIGAVTGRVVAEPPTLRTSGLPFTGTTVALLPRSDALIARLEQLKESSRQSSGSFSGAVPAMQRAREAYERELWELGAPDLATTMLVDADGAFRLEDVPAGAWMAIAWHSSTVDLAAGKVNVKERKTYRTQPRMQGFQSVTIWIRTVTVAGGETATLDLTDRNAWFRGVIEERRPDAGR